MFQIAAQQRKATLSLSRLAVSMQPSLTQRAQGTARGMIFSDRVRGRWM
jgi:hypothetical protein